MLRERIVEGMKNGLVAKEGLIAHGRGEAFDYLLGEKTIPPAELAEKIAAYRLLLAERPAISVNGNTAVLVPEEIIELGKLIGAKVEVNLFYRTEERIKNLVDLLKKHGATEVLGENPDEKIPGLDHARALCTKEGIFSSDVVLVPLEDGDRTKALKDMGKTVVTIDLNPLSRTSKAADVTIVDNVVRALPKIIEHVKQIQAKSENPEVWNKAINDFDNDKNLSDVLRFINASISG
jgi:4-phosphopantoate--beta-alanine ligase